MSFVLFVPNILSVGDILEMGAYWSIHARDEPAFERYLALLTPMSHLPPSSRTPTLLGLRLLHLLLTNPPHYHTTLARISTAHQAVQFVVNLEQCLGEGTYQRLVVARDQVPVEEYKWFVDELVEKVRGELAVGLEKSFKELAITSAAALLLLNESQVPQLVEFAKKRGWSVQGDKIVFPPKKVSIAEETSSKWMISNALNYATALEQIV